jgi:hypothetical protein
MADQTTAAIAAVQGLFGLIVVECRQQVHTSFNHGSYLMVPLRGDVIGTVGTWR